jgi:hypothetical protein
MNELETQIVDISDDALDSLFDETPSKTVSANSLVGGKKANETVADADIEDDEDEEEVVERKPSKKQAKVAPKKEVVPERTDTIEDVDLDELDKEDETDEDDEDATKEDKEAKAKAKADAAKAKAEANGKEGGEEVLSVLKSTVDYLVEQGIWQDFEGREDMEITEQTYAELVAKQDQARVQNMFDELVDSTGPFGKAIIEFTKNGGSPDEIIDLFKEQKATEAINIDSLDGQKAIIKQYYTDVMGWKPEKADKYIGNLVLSNELENEATEVKDLYGSFYKKEADRLNKEQADFVKQQKDAEVAFENNIKTAVKERKDLSAAERKTVEDYLLNYDQKLPNGNVVNKFYVNFAKMQANPQEYIDLVMFVMDKQKFVQKVATKEKSEAAAKAFNFIKGNGATSSKKGTSYDSIKKNEKVSGFNWGIPSK